MASTERPLVQASKGGCVPLLGIAPVDLQGSLEWAKGCLTFNESVIRYLARTPTIGVVVLSGRYLRYKEAGTRALVHDGAGRIHLDALPRDALIEAQRRTTEAVRALGRRVIIIGAPPQADFDVGQCWERQREALPSIHRAPDCPILASTAHRFWPWSVRLMDDFARLDATPVVRLIVCCAMRTAATQRGRIFRSIVTLPI